VKIKNRKRETGFYWVQLRNEVWIVAKWWKSYNWWTQMNSVLEADNNRNPIVYVNEERLIPPKDPVVFEKKKVKPKKRVRITDKPKPKRKRIRVKDKPKKVKRRRRK
jgi:hypothetical protein